ncbi:ROK family protein [Sulfobacillus thermosulfidooxidans]|uniref:ROK family protein n=1 Tax=Sulfobacillus thermosulfidooxidans TaxID=28034 RepID=UPI0006B44F30|nr:ROK family protein [Sulfobacillus thermosulfidooxidans]
MRERSFVLGMDFGGTKMALATADDTGTILHRADIPTLPDAQEAVSRALEVAHQLIDCTRTQYQSQLRRVGVATMGITRDSGVLLAPNVAGWRELRLPQLLHAAFPGIPVLIANDVKSAALAEFKWGALQGMDPGLYVNLGTGIAVALIASGRIIQGAHGASGEIAYNPLTEHDVYGVRDDVAPLEERVGGRAIQRRAHDELGWGLGAGDLLRRAQRDPSVRIWLEPILRTLSFQLTHLVIALDPARVVIGGGLATVHEVIFPYLRQSLNSFVPFPPELVTAHFARDAGLMGAIALALDGAQAVQGG